MNVEFNLLLHLSWKEVIKSFGFTKSLFIEKIE